MKKPLAIYGAGGLGREVLALARSLPEWELIGFFDDGVHQGALVDSSKVLGGLSQLKNWNSSLYVVIAIGNPVTKRSIVEALKDCNHITYPVLIHPLSAIIDEKSVKLGAGTILTPGCVLTTNIKVGNHVLINLNATVGHDCVVHDYVSIMPGVNIAGEVRIGEASLIGSGANVLTGVHVGKNAIVGSGSVVTKSISENDTVAGVPARSIKK
jgi:sugar O-acyltransferase (sialic acid O-acetyltransferase NeuD family)